MAEESLLRKLIKKGIGLKKMIEDDDAFVSTYYGSSSYDGGKIRYGEEQMEILFASVPRVFSYEESHNFHNPRELTEGQSIIFDIINQIGGDPSRDLKSIKIPEIIGTAQSYIIRNQRDLYLEGKLINKPRQQNSTETSLPQPTL